MGPRAERPKRRRFSAEYKTKILAEYDAAEHGERGAILRREGVHGIPEALHADRGTSMTSTPVAQLLVDLGVARSHSRPHVSLLTGQSTYLCRSAARRR